MHTERRARRVTWGAVGLLLLVGLTQVELWPLSAYRLFSAVRGESGATLMLVAVHGDGTEVVLTPAVDDPVLDTTSHQYRDLRSASPERRVAMVRAWLDLAEVGSDDVVAVRLDRATRVMDAATLTWRTTDVTTEVEVPL